MFKPGQSGNPSGRRKGVPDSRVEQRTENAKMLATWAPTLLRKTKTLALAGDMAAMALLLERALPKLKPMAVATGAPLDPTKTNEENRKAIIGAIAEGHLPIDDGATLINALKLDLSIGNAFGISIVIDGHTTTTLLRSADVVDVQANLLPEPVSTDDAP